MGIGSFNGTSDFPGVSSFGFVGIGVGTGTGVGTGRTGFGFGVIGVVGRTMGIGMGAGVVIGAGGILIGSPYGVAMI